MEVITYEGRYWDACPCAPAVMSYVSDLLGIEATRWDFGRAIIRSGHVSTMFVCTTSGDEALELWISAAQQPSGEWILRHGKLPERSRA